MWLGGKKEPGGTGKRRSHGRGSGTSSEEEEEERAETDREEALARVRDLALGMAELVGLAGEEADKAAKLTSLSIQSSKCADKAAELPKRKAFELMKRSARHALEIAMAVAQHARGVGEKATDVSKGATAMARDCTEHFSTIGAASLLTDLAMRCTALGIGTQHRGAALIRANAEVGDALQQLELSAMLVTRQE